MVVVRGESWRESGAGASERIPAGQAVFEAAEQDGAVAEEPAFKAVQDGDFGCLASTARAGRGGLSEIEDACARRGLAVAGVLDGDAVAADPGDACSSRSGG